MASSSEDADRRAGYVPFALGGAALLIGLGLAAWGSLRAPTGEPGSGAPGSAAPGSAAPGAEAGSAEAGAEAGASAGAAGASADSVGEDEAEAPYAPDLSGDDVGRPLTSEGAGAHGLAVVGERAVWIETDGARVASVPLEGGAVTVLASVDDEDAYGGGFVAGADGVFWSVGDVGGAPDPIYFVTAADLALAKPALTPLATAGSVDELALAGDLFLSDGGRLVKVDGKEPIPIAERAGRVVAMTGCAGALWWIEAPLSGRGEHALMTLDAGEVARRARLDDASRGPMGCWEGRVVWAEDRADGTHRIARLSEGASVSVAATGTVTALASAGDALYWAEIHGEGADAVSLLRRVRDGAPERLGRDRGTATALAVAGVRLLWASDDGVQLHTLGDDVP